MDPDGGGGGAVTGGPDPLLLRNHKNIGFLSKTGPDPLKNHKATKPIFNVGSLSARQQNAISMAFCFAGGPINGQLLVVFGSSFFL